MDNKNKLPTDPYDDEIRVPFNKRSLPSPQSPERVTILIEPAGEDATYPLEQGPGAEPINLGAISVKAYKRKHN